MACSILAKRSCFNGWLPGMRVIWTPSTIYFTETAVIHAPLGLSSALVLGTGVDLCGVYAWATLVVDHVRR